MTSVDKGWLLAALLAGCGPEPMAETDGAVSTTGATTGATTGTTTGTTTTTTTGSAATSSTTTASPTTTSTTGGTSETESTSTTDGSFIMPPDFGPSQPCMCAAGELCVQETGIDSFWKICVLAPEGCDPAQKCSEACMQACINPAPPSKFCTDDPDLPLGCSDGVSVCSPWAQNCPQGQKCAPSEFLSPFWELECVPVAESAPAIGEPCLGKEASPTGADDCAMGALCWPVEGDAAKTCVGQCGGSPEAPICPPDQVCATTREGTVTACVPACDPLVQDCPLGQVCTPGLDGFGCTPDVSGPDGDFLDNCTSDGCDPGFYCTPDAWQPSCQHSRCCVQYCDVDAPDCPVGNSCVSPFVLLEDEPPPAWAHVGVCVIPP
ncbi:hypothetical protein [Nannocystis radixulma]|uniref:Uncharacterized protein n=1 Tax=Nannocystis radixulma TaxID=2995305 RepID=A0ABT5B8C6_9BACT|nr:hypothetical protein [Nannocystis radixulma]MDC0670361.1 hypothetical protein [Nannocystis radixulma]